MSYTQGPWKYVTDFKCGNGDITSGVVSTVSGGAVAWPQGADAIEEIANAKLIAAAPEMFELLPRIRSELSSLVEDTLCAKDPDRSFSSVADEVRAHPLIKDLDQVIRRIGVPS